MKRKATRWKELKIWDWVEFFFSGVPVVDWWYAITYTPTRLERVIFPQFVKRPQRDWVIATAEHFVYFILGFLYVKYVSLFWSIVVGAFAFLIVVPLEFLMYKWKVRLFQTLSWEELALTIWWNIFNAGLYWTLGCLVGLIL